MKRLLVQIILFLSAISGTVHCSGGTSRPGCCDAMLVDPSGQINAEPAEQEFAYPEKAVAKVMGRLPRRSVNRLDDQRVQMVLSASEKINAIMNKKHFIDKPGQELKLKRKYEDAVIQAGFENVGQYKQAKADLLNAWKTLKLLVVLEKDESLEPSKKKALQDRVAGADVTAAEIRKTYRLRKKLAKIFSERDQE